MCSLLVLVNVFHSTELSTTANFVFVIEVSGFQHGNLPFYIKRLSVAPVTAGSYHTFTFNTDFSLLQQRQSTFNLPDATRIIHGINLDEPGLAYDLRYDVVQSTLKDLPFTSQ